MLQLAAVNKQRTGKVVAIYNDGKFITVVTGSMLFPTLKKWIHDIKEEYKP